VRSSWLGRAEALHSKNHKVPIRANREDKGGRR
jgi:hypothetical protein